MRLLIFGTISVTERGHPVSGLGGLINRAIPICLIHPFIGYALNRAGKRVSSKGGEVRWIRDFDSRRPPDRSPGAFFFVPLRCYPASNLLVPVLPVQIENQGRSRESRGC